MIDIKKKDGGAYEQTTLDSFASCLHSQEKEIKMLFTGLGRSVLEETVPEILSTAQSLRPRALLFCRVGHTDVLKCKPYVQIHFVNAVILHVAREVFSTYYFLWTYNW